MFTQKFRKRKMRYQLRAWDDSDDSRDSAEIEFEVEELPRVLSKLCDFLRAVGFSYVSGMSVVSKVTNKNETDWKYHKDDAGEYP